MKETNSPNPPGNDRPGYELYDSIDRFVRRRVRQSADAADIVQEIFLRLTRQEPPVTVAKVRAWLYQTARNCLIDFWRRRERERSIGSLDESGCDVPSCEKPSAVEKEEETQMMLTLVNELDEVHQEVLRLKFQEGLSYDEIAKVIDRPKTTVGWLLHESLTELRGKMAASTGKNDR